MMAAEPVAEFSVRDLAMSAWDIVNSAKSLVWWKQIGKADGKIVDRHFSLDTFRSFLMYAVEHPGRRKKTPMDVQDMVSRWLPIVKGLATAHEKAALDRCEFDSEQHLAPLLTAPVKQIREFYAALVLALKNDPQIPFFVWAMFECWGDTILKTAPDGDVKHLKTQLAHQIAEMVEEDVKPDLKAAIAGALQWRSEETLEKVKAAVHGGAKARMVGKESCLFLSVPMPNGREECVML